MDILSAIEYIISINSEMEAIEKLLASHKRKHDKQFRQLCDREKSLRSICKWNRAKYHDEAIDVLSDVDSYDED